MVITSSRHFHSRSSTRKFCSISFSQLFQQKRVLESQISTTLISCNGIQQIKQVHAHILRKGLEHSSLVLTKLIRTLTKLDIPMDSYPRLIFDQVQNPTSFMWTAIIRGYSLQGFTSESFLMYKRMRREGIRPTSFTYSALFKACGGGDVVDAAVFGRQLHANVICIGGFESDLHVCNTLIDMYVNCGLIECGRRLFDEMPERDVISWTSMVVAYTKNGDMESAADLFYGLRNKDAVVCTAMLTGYVQNGKPKEALELFESMMKDNVVKIDEVTLVGAISACAQLGSTENANWIRIIADKEGFDLAKDVVVGSALIDMYSKCGSVEEAYRIFQGMRERNVFSYTAMITGFAMHGRAESAVKLFYDMLETEIKPNEVTFIGVLTACSHAGMVKQGKEILEKMHNDFGLTPSADHYTCIVDMLGRSGCLEEAFELVENMPVKPHGGVWGALLGACKVHKNVEIAEIAAEHLSELEPDNIGNLVLLSNIYSSAVRGDDVSRIRRLIKKKQLKKKPGCSWVETRDGWCC
ncbi:pentatricopeptide repeat-containing protein At5g44230 [Papaver somniferum]|uniref:pentatricopeptide repeat-containing protein At5g44230 n=1 Tax=Papaver somniferum TaxID=3469 RepID=UPI000E6FF3EE|nr:pentatricopeptide repeat-containing protein At5g44230 [Papaver somniferum]